MSQWPTATQAMTVRPDLHAALARARRDVLVITTMGIRPGGRRGIPFLVDHRGLRPGVRHRVLVPEGVRLAAPAATRLGDLARAGAHVRMVPDVPVDALVVDGSLAVLPGTPTGAVMLRVFESLWSAGTPFDVAGLNTREQQVLAMLSAGRTDESMATQLGLSVRTVRRMISTLMERLDARSRFQAGVRAASRGWPTAVSRRPTA